METVLIVIIISFMVLVVWGQYLEQVERHNKRKDDKE